MKIMWQILSIQLLYYTKLFKTVTNLPKKGKTGSVFLRWKRIHSLKVLSSWRGISKGDGPIFLKTSAPLLLTNSFRMRPLLAWSVSLDSTLDVIFLFCSSLYDVRLESIAYRTKEINFELLSTLSLVFVLHGGYNRMPLQKDAFSTKQFLDFKNKF